MITYETAQRDCGWLGRIIRLHSISKFDIVEYLPNREDSNPMFTTYVNGKRTSMSWATLDSALLHCICQANEPNALNSAQHLVPALGRALNIPQE